MNVWRSSPPKKGSPGVLTDVYEKEHWVCKEAEDNEEVVDNQVSLQWIEDDRVELIG